MISSCHNRRTVFTLVIFLGLHLICQASSYAQRGKQSPQDRAQRLKEYLSLTDEQTANVTAIYENAQKEISANAPGARGDRDAQRQTMRNIMGKADSQIDQLLTDTQKTKYAEWKKKRGGMTPRMDRRKEDPDKQN